MICLLSCWSSTTRMRLLMRAPLAGQRGWVNDNSGSAPSSAAASSAKAASRSRPLCKWASNKNPTPAPAYGSKLQRARQNPSLAKSEAPAAPRQVGQNGRSPELSREHALHYTILAIFAEPILYGSEILQPTARLQAQPVSTSGASASSGANSTPLIVARALSKTYAAGAAGITALRDLDFEIHDAEFVSVVGQSGCGKSTLLKVLGGLLPFTSGSVELNGKPLRGPSPEAAMVFQSPVLLPWRTVLENVLLPIEFHKLAKSAYRAHALDLLAMVGLKDFGQRYPYELSGGMQQRAALVRALVQDPRLLLMDEPFGALDAMTREQLNLELMRIWSGSRKTVIFVTHSIAEAIFLSDRVIAMTARPGRIAEIITIDLPRPRDLSIINTDRFGRHAERLRSLLDARGGMF
jgi:NitT/TauT family transport system ATP-binding protein